MTWASFDPPPKLYVVARSEERYKSWLLAHYLPRRAAVWLTSALAIRGLPLVRVVDLNEPLPNDQQHTAMLVELHRMDHAGRVVWCTEDQVARLAIAWGANTPLEWGYLPGHEAAPMPAQALITVLPREQDVITVPLPDDGTLPPTSQ